MQEDSITYPTFQKMTDFFQWAVLSMQVLQEFQIAGWLPSEQSIWKTTDGMKRTENRKSHRRKKGIQETSYPSWNNIEYNSNPITK